MSRAGDMGYTTGPWEFKNDIQDAKPVAFGNFLTVWKRQADGSWKFAIDLGISNPQPDTTAPQWQLPKNSKLHTSGGTQKVEDERASLRSNDLQFSSASSARGADKAFASFAADDVTVLREGKSPFVGKARAGSALPGSSTTWTWEPAFVDVSGSADLGYTYGTYVIASKDATAKTLETGNYYRIWKKENGRWQVLFDLTNPIPPQTKTD
jgi:ketosteroid isomerase-like protein